jgi:hypothetical protein
LGRIKVGALILSGKSMGRENPAKVSESIKEIKEAQRKDVRFSLSCARRGIPFGLSQIKKANNTFL